NSLVGDLPPATPTLRAKAGAAVIKIIRQALFWYSAQILSFQRLVTAAADEQRRAIALVRERLDRVERAVASTHRLESSLREAERQNLELKAQLAALTSEVVRRDRELIERVEEHAGAWEKSRQEFDGELKRVARLADKSKVFGLQQS